MSCKSAAILALVLGGLIVPGHSTAQSVKLAQLVPPAGSAGAGNSAVNGIPYGPANPSVLSDPSGIRNASRMPPLGTNSPAPPVSYGSVSSPSTRVVTPDVGVGASQRIISARRTDSRRRPFRGRGRGQAEVSKFTGICRGC
jgi:hypothetical protein